MKSPNRGGESARNVIGPNVRSARLAATPPLTQDQLSGKLAAKKLFLDRAAIAKIETGRRCVFDFEIAAIAGVLKVDVRWLLGLPSTGDSSRAKKRVS